MRLWYGRSAFNLAWIISLPLSPTGAVVVLNALVPLVLILTTLNGLLGNCGGGSDVIDRDCFIVMAHDCEFATPVNSLFRDAVEEEAWSSLDFSPIALATAVSPCLSAANEVVALVDSNSVRLISSFITGILVVSPPLTLLCDS